jgi:hypothetical protein
MDGIGSFVSRCASIVMNSYAGNVQVFPNLLEDFYQKPHSVWPFTLYNAAETVIFQVFPRIRKNLSPLTGAEGGHIECPDNRISIIGVCGHDRRAKRSSLNCSGPTRRRTQQTDLHGFFAIRAAELIHPLREPAMIQLTLDHRCFRFGMSKWSGF